MLAPEKLRGIVIIAGHYGVGKTNLALNVAVDAAHAGVKVTLADMDIVNPYFRSSDYLGLLEEAGVDVIAPLFAGTSLDSPGLSNRLSSAIDLARAEENRLLVIDAGGDDVGATCLGRFAPKIAAEEYGFIYVVNAYRNLTQDPAEAVEILREIEFASHLTATGIVNNSHLRLETDAETIISAIPYGQRVAQLTNLPLLAQTVPLTCSFDSDSLKSLAISDPSYYPVNLYVTTPWE